MIKFSQTTFDKLQELITLAGYTIRTEKGNFKSGYCLLRDQKVMIVNKFYTTEGKINALLDILKIITLDTTKFTEKSQRLYEELTQTEIKA